MIGAIALCLTTPALQIEAKEYVIGLSGPYFEAFVDYIDTSYLEQIRENLTRRIMVLVAGPSMRCDTDGRVSVYRHDNEYVFLDHARKAALVFPPEVSEDGRRAVCAVTPFWPESVGDCSSFGELERRRATKSAILGDEEDWIGVRTRSYVPLSDEEYRRQSSSGLVTNFQITTSSDVVFRNVWYCASDHSDGSLEVLWSAQTAYSSGQRSPKTVLVQPDVFEIPADYSVFTPKMTARHPNAMLLDVAQIKAFTERFPIPAAFPKSLAR